MNASHLNLSCGSPQFPDSRLVALAKAEGSLAAWRDLLAHNPPSTSIQVKGDFAVGLREPGGRIFLAVDRFAIQTLCYRVDNGQLWFASRADELRDTTTDIDPQAVFDYLYFHTIPSPRTIFKNVHRLPPGHYAVFEKGKLTVTAYWKPCFNEQHEASFENKKNEFRQLLLDSVASQLDGTQPACFLSGGTDSSTIAGMATLASSEPVATYSIGFDAQGYDEMAYARLAARHFKTRHHEYYVKPADLIRSIPMVASHFDQPFGNSSALPAYYCAKMACEDGVSKLLAGDGGDELFGGNSRYAKQRIFGWYDHVPEAIRTKLMNPMLATPMAARFAITRKAASYVEQARAPMPDRLQMYNLIMRLGVHQVMTPQLLALVDLKAPLQLQRQVWRTATDCTALNRELTYDWRFTLAESDLPKVRGATCVAGVEVGFPMLDDRLLAFSQGLPSTDKLKGLQLRWFFKSALQGFLPEEILQKKKQGFGLPFGVWANAHTGLRALATDSLKGLAERGLVREDFIKSLLIHKLPEHPGYYGEMVWILMMLEQWLRARAPNYRLS
jgi:asparagine synthase (glutamine-hydrolysing)